MTFHGIEKAIFRIHPVFFVSIWNIHLDPGIWLFYFLFLFFYCYFCFYSLSFFLLLFSDSYFSGFIPYIFCQNGSFSAILTR